MIWLNESSQWWVLGFDIKACVRKTLNSCLWFEENRKQHLPLWPACVPKGGFSLARLSILLAESLGHLNFNHHQGGWVPSRGGICARTALGHFQDWSQFRVWLQNVLRLCHDVIPCPRVTGDQSHFLVEFL